MPFVTADHVSPVPTPWLWPGRIALGYLSMVDGDPGIGKSLLTIDICARISTGRPFPDGAAMAGPGSVVIINAEDGGGDVITGRLRAAGADLTRVHLFQRAFDEPFLRLPSDVRRLRDVIASSEAQFVVIDPIMGFLDEGVNVPSDCSVRTALAPLAALAQRSISAIQMIRHLNKGTSTNALYRGLYSIGFSASCRVNWLIARNPRRARQYVLAQAKNNLDTVPPSLTFSIETAANGHPRLVWHGQSLFSAADLFATSRRRSSEQLRAQEFLLNLLRDGPRDKTEIFAAARELSYSKSTLYRAREVLGITINRQNLGHPTQTSHWSLPVPEQPAPCLTEEFTPTGLPNTAQGREQSERTLGREQSECTLGNDRNDFVNLEEVSLLQAEYPCI